MKTLVKPVKDEENPLVKGYCEDGYCKPACTGACYQTDCGPKGNTGDIINPDDEILF